jgi:hypothetical protein
MRLGFDLNGVVRDAVSLKRRVLLEDYGMETDAASCRRVALLGRGFPPAEHHRLSCRLKETTLALEAPPIPFAVEGLSRLATQHEVALYTGTIPSAMDNCRAWLEAFGLGEIELVGVGRVGESKGPYVMGCNVYTDDKATRIYEAVGFVPNLLYFGGHSEELAIAGVRSVGTWHELGREIDALTAAVAA